MSDPQGSSRDPQSSPRDDARSTPGSSKRESRQRLDALSDVRCRLVVEFLAETHETTTVDDLAAVVTGRLAEKVVDAPPRLAAVRVSLVHRHLPMLDDAGLVSFDHETGLVEREFTGDATVAVRKATSEAG